MGCRDKPTCAERTLRQKKIVGVIISLLGVVVMTTNIDFSFLGQGAIMADLLVICAGVLWAFFIVYNKPLVKDNTNLIKSLTWLLIFTLIPLLPPAAFSADTLGSLPLDAWITIFYTAIFCWVIPYYLWVKGLRYISAVTSSVVLLTEIIVAVAVATLVLGEVFTVISGVGALFIIIAILLVS